MKPAAVLISALLFTSAALAQAPTKYVLNTPVDTQQGKFFYLTSATFVGDGIWHYKTSLRNVETSRRCRAMIEAIRWGPLTFEPQQERLAIDGDWPGPPGQRDTTLRFYGGGPIGEASHDTIIYLPPPNPFDGKNGKTKGIVYLYIPRPSGDISLTPTVILTAESNVSQDANRFFVYYYISAKITELPEDLILRWDAIVCPEQKQYSDGSLPLDGLARDGILKISFSTDRRPHLRLQSVRLLRKSNMTTVAEALLPAFAPPAVIIRE